MATLCTSDLMCNKFFKLIVLFILAACSSGSPEKISQTTQFKYPMPKKILLFVPGYYGTQLQEEDSGEIRWANASNFLFSQKGLSTEIPGTKIGTAKKMVTSGLLETVTLLPRLWHVDSYGKTLGQLDRFAFENGMRLETVAYDWRDDFTNCLITIDQKIKELNLGPDDELYVVSHSMGALLMSYYIRYGAQDVDSAVENWEGLTKIKKLVLAAPPLHGLMILFRDMEDGTSVGLNRTLLGPRDYSTFKSSYYFLPPKGEDIAIEEDGEKKSFEIHDIKKWERNQWGPFRFATTSEVPIVRSFVEKYMTRSEKFHALLRAPIKNSPPKKMPVLQIRGLGHDTLELASVKTKNGRIGYSFGKEGRVDGDGTVTEKSGRPLEFFKALEFSKIDTGLGHLEVVSLPESQIFIQDFLRK